jgi:hypothetical protein
MKHKVRNTFLILTISIVAIVGLIILFISPIAKYLLERYDKEILGREITVDWVYVNPFSGYVYISNIHIFEQNGDSVFISAAGLSANMAMLKLLHLTYEISECTLDRPIGYIIQDKKILNFSDLIERFTPKHPNPNGPVHFNILNIKIKDGEFNYYAKRIHINYFIKKVNIESSGKRWDSDTLAAKVSLLPGTNSGDLNGEFGINFVTLDYKFHAVTRKYDLQIIEQYLQDLINYGHFTANVDADVKAFGNFKNEENITIKGTIAVNEFHFGKNKNEDYASFEKLVLAIKEVSPLNHQYLLDSVSLNKPFFKYERYDHLDNLETMFGKKGANITAAQANPSNFNLVIEIAKYVKVLAKNFFRSSYKVDRLAIYAGDFKFNDYSISEKFSVEMNPLYATADSIDKNHKRVEVFLNSGIKPYGLATISLSINPNDSADFDLKYKLQGIPVSLFNPYIVSYTSFPLDRGTLEVNGDWHVQESVIKSTNHLLIIDPRVTKRIRNKDNRWIPLPLIMSFVRERGDVIDYEIPITGDLKNPKFHFQDVLFDVVDNIFMKPITTPYRMEVKNVETEIEKSLSIKWPFRGSTLLPSQKKFIGKLVQFLKDNPGSSISVHPKQYADKEKEHILFFEAKKKFYLSSLRNGHLFSEEDSERVDKMSIKDSAFIKYLHKHIHKELLFTVQEECAQVIDSNYVNSKFEQLNKARENTFLAYFEDGGVKNQVNVLLDKNMIPYNGFSFYKIKYKGDFPDYLIKAYCEMDEMNQEPPRKKFRKERKKYKIL